MAFKYGDKEEAKSYIAINIPNAPEDKVSILLDNTLKAADTFVDSGIEEADLPPLTGSDYPSVIVEAATFYATAVALQSLFSGNEDENKKPKFYLDEAERFLSKYISKKTRELLKEENNPYSISQSPVDREYL